MKLLVIGAGMMGSAAAYDLARSSAVTKVTLADADKRRAMKAAGKVNRLIGSAKVRAIELDAAKERDARKVMLGHNAVLSCVPYFFNLTLAKAAIEARCHFADLGGNNAVTRKEYALARQAEKHDLAIAPDCGLSPGMGSILAGELVRRMGGHTSALKIYVGGLPVHPKPPFGYQLVFSVEGLINEYCEPARVLRDGNVVEIEPLTEMESFQLEGLPTMIAFHTSGGTSTLPETFAGRVRECFEKTLRYPGHFELIRCLYDLGLFSSQPRKIGEHSIVPRALMSQILSERFAGNEPDMVVMRVEAHGRMRGPEGAEVVTGSRDNSVLAFTVIDYFDPATGMSAMARTTAWSASVVTEMLASGEIRKRGGIYQEIDVPANEFLNAMKARGISIEYSEKL